jgi:hypothetical protein
MTNLVGLVELRGLGLLTARDRALAGLSLK